eukprot:COSAG02_NODE_65584_length_257_cov_1.537975_1_plen_35_part_01
MDSVSQRGGAEGVEGRSDTVTWWMGYCSHRKRTLP